MQATDIALAPIPQADGVIKNRPVLILSTIPPFDDVLVCAVSTQLRHEVKDLDVLITETDADFKQSGLIADSLIRSAHIATLPATKLRGVIGSISKQRFDLVIGNLVRLLTSKGK
jgi:mRNA interferase MazF